MYSSLLSKPKQGLKLIERIARLQRLGVSETKAIIDICKWKEDDFLVFMQVQKMFERYETKDIFEKTRSTTHSSEAKMSRGEVQTMTNTLLLKLSRMHPFYFVKISESIKEGKISVKGAAEEFEKDQQRLVVVSQIEVLAKKEIGILVQEYPNSFTAPVVDSFRGAAPDNDKGAQLKTYVQQVLEGKQPEYKVIRLEHVKQMEEVVENCDTLVVNLDEPKNGEDQNEKLLEASVKKEITSILLFPSETEQLDALLLLRMKTEVLTKQLLFEKKNDQKEVFDENLKFGLICGKLEAVQGTLKIFNGKIENLRSVVGQVTPSGGKVSSVTSGTNQDLLIVHSEDFKGLVSYYGTETQLKSVQKIAEKEGFLVTLSKPEETNNNSQNRETKKIVEDSEDTEDNVLSENGKENGKSKETREILEDSEESLDDSSDDGKENSESKSDGTVDPYSTENIDEFDTNDFAK